SHRCFPESNWAALVASIAGMPRARCSPSPTQPKRRLLNILLAVSVWFGLPAVSHGQRAAMHFSHLSATEGLSQNSSQSIMQDSQGFMWLGTQAGLNRFDGYS